jgi:DedD protein
MPFFNFRRASSTTPNAPGAAQPESMEVVRKRAKHRLIGTAVLVLAGVVGFPLLFDTQPRPIAVDIPIEIPSKNTVKPLVMPAKPDAAADLPASTAPVAAASSLTPQEEIVTQKPAASPAAGPVTPAPAADKNEAKPVAKADVKADDGARARALLEGQAPSPPASAPAEGRMVVQVGAFADANKAKEVRQRLEKAGLKTYTQVAETKEGKRIRVRVGPFATKAEADNAASKIKTLDLPASILTL